MTSGAFHPMPEADRRGKSADGDIARGAAAGDVRDADAQYQLGRALREKGAAKDAVEHLALAAAASPPHLVAAEELAAMLFEHGYKREGISLIDGLLGRAAADSGREPLVAMRRQRAAEHTVVSIHQPAYLPWLGYLHKIYYCDRFVILDDVKYSKNSFIKRVLVKKRDDQNETAYLSVPLRKHSDFAKIGELACAESDDWRAEHLRKIAAAYGRTRHFKTVFPALEDAFAATRDQTSLVELTGTLLARLLALLKVERPIVQSSSIAECSAIPDAHERNMRLVACLGGDVYFSGSVARDYQAGKLLPAGMKLIYQDFWNFLENAPYAPREKFINGLSAIDALFNIGPDGVLELFERYQDPILTRHHLFPEPSPCLEPGERAAGGAASLVPLE